MIRRPPRSTLDRSSAASDVYKRQWHSTDGPENHQLAQDIYRALKANGLITTKTIEQFLSLIHISEPTRPY